MKNQAFIVFLITFLLVISCNNAQEATIKDDRFHTRIVDLKEEKLQLFWKADDGKLFKSFENLKIELQKEGTTLTYAMNGGMYLKDHSPQGLYIEKGKILNPLDTIQKAFGNFYLQPNGVLGITKDGEAIIKKSTAITVDNLQYATQSGPMLVIEGQLHPAFNDGSKNLHIRNAVGVLPDGKLLFVISKKKINFYDLATFFQNQGCKNALYLDGFVSRIYDPAINVQQLDGKYGVIIGITG